MGIDRTDEQYFAIPEDESRDSKILFGLVDSRFCARYWFFRVDAAFRH